MLIKTHNHSLKNQNRSGSPWEYASICWNRMRKLALLYNHFLPEVLKVSSGQKGEGNCLFSHNRSKPPLVSNEQRITKYSTAEQTHQLQFFCHYCRIQNKSHIGQIIQPPGVLRLLQLSAISEYRAGISPPSVINWGPKFPVHIHIGFVLIHDPKITEQKKSIGIKLFTQRYTRPTKSS